MDEVERQRATREAQAQARKGQHSGRFGLLSYLAAQGYAIGRERTEEREAPSVPPREHR
jgi:hypothetical protein